MFKVNDYVVYGLMGICQIADIRKDEYNLDDETEYYILHSIHDTDMTTIMVPVNNPNISIRLISTKDDVLSLIAAIPEMETVWTDDDKQRAKIYKAALKTGKPEEWIKIIKAIYLERKARSVAGRRLTKTDEDIFNVAEKHLYEEFAVALNIPPDEVLPCIHKRIS
ncbi:MAG: CarD family transcriptional regulator [Chitinophagales bacterium]